MLATWRSSLSLVCFVLYMFLGCLYMQRAPIDPVLIRTYISIYISLDETHCYLLVLPHIQAGFMKYTGIEWDLVTCLLSQLTNVWFPEADIFRKWYWNGLTFAHKPSTYPAIFNSCQVKLYLIPLASRFDHYWKHNAIAWNAINSTVRFIMRH